MPLSTKIGGQARYITNREANCLTNNQARYIYKKIESESIVNVDTIKQEIEADTLDRNNGKINPYHKIITNKVEKDDTILQQMEQDQYLAI